MNIIFLDIDGVLNNWEEAKEHYTKTKKTYFGYDWPFSKKSMKVLRKLIKESNSNIVLSSSWRNSKKGRKIFKKALKKYHIEDKLIGYTEYLNGQRELEIQKYLDNLNEKVNFIILDDENHFNKLEKNLVLVDSFYGFEEKDVEKALTLFKVQKKGKL